MAVGWNELWAPAAFYDFGCHWSTSDKGAQRKPMLRRKPMLGRKPMQGKKEGRQAGRKEGFLHHTLGLSRQRIGRPRCRREVEGTSIRSASLEGLSLRILKY